MATKFLTLSMAAASLLLVAASQPVDKTASAVDCTSERSNVPAYAELAKEFSYPASAPLNLNVLSKSEADGVDVESIEFHEPKGGGVCSAALIIPSGKAPFPAVVWMASDDKDWQIYATEFSKSGAISIVLDKCPEISWEVAPAEFRDRMIRNVITIRRAVDLLLSRKDVDLKRIAYVGHSFGAMIGADAVALDRRFKAAIFESGLEGMSYFMCSGTDLSAIHMRQSLDGRLPQFINAIAPIDSIHYVGRETPTVLLFQSARLDKGVPEPDAKAFFDAASEPKHLLWYDTGHEMLLPAVTRDRTNFLKNQLKMR